MFPLAEILGIGTKLIDKLIPDPEAKAKAQMELAQLAQNGELAKMNADLEAYKTEQNNLTERLKADMASGFVVVKEHSSAHARRDLARLFYLPDDERVPGLTRTNLTSRCSGNGEC